MTPALWMYTDRKNRCGNGTTCSRRTRHANSWNSKQRAIPFFAALLESLDAKELPPFEVIAPYWQPSVGVIYDTDTGFHGISFTVRSETAPTP